MKINILSIGKFDNSPHEDVFLSYLKRLRWSVVLKEIVVKNSCNISKEKRINLEEENLLKHIKSESKVIICDQDGLEFSSLKFANKISNLALNGNSNLSFLIGGSDGFSENFLNKFHDKISFGKMTFPHLMVRSILIEQLYRAQTIIDNHPYHRE